MDVEVSILCLAYNHEKYIRQALEGMVRQETNFKFEILIHDDASTDNTANIIRDYEKNYPDIVKPIFQTENQYSKGVNIQLTYNIPRIRGAYVAFCEGDDYWTDVHKLQKQVDFMQLHPKCTLCVHNASKVNVNGEKVGVFFNRIPDGPISCDEVIRYGGGFCATCSIMAPSELYINKPDYFNILDMDFVLQMYFASSGETYCLKDNMSAYRMGVEGSWSQRIGLNVQKYMAHYRKAQEVKRAFDEYTGYVYHDAVEQSLLSGEYKINLISGQYKNLLKEPLKSSDFAKRQSIKRKIRILLGAYFPFVLKLVLKIKRHGVALVNREGEEISSGKKTKHKTK